MEWSTRGRREEWRMRGQQEGVGKEREMMGRKGVWCLHSAFPKWRRLTGDLSTLYPASIVSHLCRRGIFKTSRRFERDKRHVRTKGCRLRMTRQRKGRKKRKKEKREKWSEMNIFIVNTRKRRRGMMKREMKNETGI